MTPSTIKTMTVSAPTPPALASSPTSLVPRRLPTFSLPAQLSLTTTETFTSPTLPLASSTRSLPTTLSPSLPEFLETAITLETVVMPLPPRSEPSPLSLSSSTVFTLSTTPTSLTSDTSTLTPTPSRPSSEVEPPKPTERPLSSTTLFSPLISRSETLETFTSPSVKAVSSAMIPLLTSSSTLLESSEAAETTETERPSPPSFFSPPESSSTAPRSTSTSLIMPLILSGTSPSPARTPSRPSSRELDQLPSPSPSFTSPLTSSLEPTEGSTSLTSCPSRPSTSPLSPSPLPLESASTPASETIASPSTLLLCLLSLTTAPSFALSS
mmetsp:Transcript_24571/g.41181  ORF Transcript_24571/g.41181 Transcript_24571/m.41181 type:complete len:326 (+) Transcript_24571:840-1817(+)